VIKDWISKHSPKVFSELLRAFPQETRGGGMFVPLSEAKTIYKKQGIDRHFLGEDEIIQFSDLSQYAISNQWGKGNIVKFLTHAMKLGYEIKEIS